ncbi:M20/M25/M40 family metallo-hydrolase, partial [Shewanella algae]|uniref:M20/M25/M40 family metallo-hydrolase n=1 Tax=Shewanella algae TaxID=38313 RepID=UPI00313ED184
DAAGNLVGRLEGGTPGLPALLLGSHLDTVPDAGRYDGILGVLSAIAVVRRIAPRAGSLPFAVEVVAFGDEEGTRFGTTLLGSAAVAGAWRE